MYLVFKLNECFKILTLPSFDFSYFLFLRFYFLPLTSILKFLLSINLIKISRGLFKRLASRPSSYTYGLSNAINYEVWLALIYGL